MFDVEAEGRSYQEMHVDGGAVSQAFLVPPSLNAREVSQKVGYRRKVVAYIIRNGRLTTDWSDVDPLTLSIAAKAVSTMINYNGLGDLYRMYLETQRAKAAFNVAYIEKDFHAPHPYEFDPAFMRALYSYAYEKAARGYPWRMGRRGLTAERNKRGKCAERLSGCDQTSSDLHAFQHGRDGDAFLIYLLATEHDLLPGPRLDSGDNILRTSKGSMTAFPRLDRMLGALSEITSCAPKI